MSAKRITEDKTERQLIIGTFGAIAIAFIGSLIYDSIANRHREVFDGYIAYESSAEEEEQNNRITIDEINKERYDLDNAIKYEINGRTVYIIQEKEEVKESSNATFDENNFNPDEDGIYLNGTDKNEDEEDDNPLEFDNVDEMISFYSDVFEINESTAKKKFEEIILKDIIGWENDNIINGKKYKSKEEAIARLMHSISKNYKDYGIKKKNIKSNEKYQLNKYIPEELVYKFCDVLDVNPYIAMAIGYTESGRNLKSGLYVYRHNIGGIKGSHGFVKYKNEAEGLFSYVKMLHDKYHVTSESGKKKIDKIASKYCPASDTWENIVKDIYNELYKKGYDHNYQKYHKKGRDLILVNQDEPSNEEGTYTRTRSK